MSEPFPGFNRAQYEYENRMPPEAPDCGCDESDDPNHDSEACLADQREAALEAKAEQQREDDFWERERRGW